MEKSLKKVFLYLGETPRTPYFKGENPLKSPFLIAAICTTKKNLVDTITSELLL